MVVSNGQARFARNQLTPLTTFSHGLYYVFGVFYINFTVKSLEITPTAMTTF
jgi:hypothetical protein